jgi:hypothetical protein
LDFITVKITSFRRKSAEGRRVGTFCIDVENISLNRLTLIRNADGELRVFGKDLNTFIADIAKAALAHAEAGND